MDVDSGAIVHGRRVPRRPACRATPSNAERVGSGALPEREQHLEVYRVHPGGHRQDHISVASRRFTPSSALPSGTN
jgi:hypothetical protein